MANDYTRLFDAIQKSFSPKDMTEDSIYNWLVHGTRTSGKEIKGKDKSGRTIYRDKKLEGSSGKRRIARTLSETQRVYGRIEDARTLEDLDRLKGEASSVTVHSRTLLSYIDERSQPMIRLKEKIDTQVRDYKRKVDEIKRLPIEEQKALFKGSGTAEERELAGVAIGEVSPARLGGLIGGFGGEKSAGVRALQIVFG